MCVGGDHPLVNRVQIELLSQTVGKIAKMSHQIYFAAYNKIKSVCRKHCKPVADNRFSALDCSAKSNISVEREKAAPSVAGCIARIRSWVSSRENY